MNNQGSSTDDKPLGASLGWQRLATTRPYQSRWHNLRQDTVRLPSGEEITYTYQEHPGFITVVPVTSDGQVVLIRSYRYTVDDWCLELPAGGLGDNQGVPLIDVARQELVEETGGIAQVIDEVGWFYSMNGTSSARCTIFLARGVVLSESTQLEPTEQSEVHLVPIAQALQMARDGRITDGDSAHSLLRCEAHLMGKQRSIEVVPYDPQWPRLFEAEAARLAAVFGEELLSIHHMGSTAVPGLWAKPVIDIMPIVRDIERVNSYNDLMLALGYLPRESMASRAGASSTWMPATAGCSTSTSTSLATRRSPATWNSSITCAPTPRTPQPTPSSNARLASQYSDDIDSYVTGKTELVKQIEKKIATWKQQ